MPAPERKLEVHVNVAKREIEIVLLAKGSRVDSIVLSIEGAVNHVRGIINAVDMIQGKGAAKTSGLILPGDPGYRAN